MKANELMIGDWVQHPVYIGNLAPCRVVGIASTEITVEFETGARKYEALKFAQPIPLTTEILKRNGFKDIGGDDDIYQLEEKPFWFWVDFMNHQYGCEFDTSTYECESSEHRLKLYGIPSVHELQHALRLCGIEKEIEL